MGWLDALGWVGSALLVWSLLQSRQLRLRALNLVACLVLIAFNAALGVWPQAAMNVVLAGINLFFLYRLVTTRHDQRTYQVVEVRTDDDFLSHLLRVHADDIARFNPGFQWSGGPSRSAFVVLSGDSVVGVVVIIRAERDVAHVELDYVTKPYRDFTPGEFVYRSSHLFTSRGFRRVLTPPGQVAPYYGRIGFAKAGESYVLELAGE